MPANVETMAYRYAGRADIPWHGLGARIGRDERITAHEFMIRAGADWTMSKRPVWWRPAEDAKALRHPNMHVLQRNDTHAALSIVSSQYKEVQNLPIFTFFHEFIERGDMVLETGGILDEGRKAWALATLKEGFTLAGGDTVTGHLLLSDSRDGGALRAKFTPVRVVCANTLALALSRTSADSQRGEFRLNHRTRFDPNAAKTALGISHQLMVEMRQQAQHLRDHSMSGAAFHEFLEKLFPPKIVVDGKGDETLVRPRAFEYALDTLDTQKGADMGRGTWWQGFNAITYMLDHNKNRISDNASRLNNSWFGSGNVLRQKALNTALEMAR